MDINEIISRPETSFKSTWQKSLKCCICLELYNRPHTLRCGHSFCLRCLSHLACTTRQQYLQIQITKLKIVCPTCRRPQMALPFLKQKVSINYALQELVENWLKEGEMIRGKSIITLRSISTSTRNDKVTFDQRDIAKEEFGELPGRLDLTVAFSEGDTERSNNNEGMNSHATCAWCHGFQDDNDDNGVAEESDNEHNNERLGDTFRFALADLQDAVFEMFQCPSRIIMAIVWTAYTVSVLVIANGFLPYMFLYSLLFLLILYTETLEQRRNRQL